MLKLSINLKQKITLLFLCITFALSSAQIRESRHTAFGYNPSVISDSLYTNIKKATSTIQKFNAYEALAYIHIQYGNLDSIVYYGQKMFDVIDASSVKEKEKLTANATNIIGLGKLKKGLFDESLKWYLKGVKLSENLEDKNEYYKNSIGLGISKFARGDKKEGFKIIKDCIENAPNQKIKHDAIFDFGKMQFYNKDTAAALASFKNCLNFYRVEGYLKKELSTLISIGVVEDIKNNNEQALDLYFEVFNKALPNQFYDLYIDAANSIGKLYAKQGNYESAKRILTTVHINAVQWENLEAQKQVLNTLRTIYYETDDYKNAYALMTQLRSVDNELLATQNKAQVNELEVQYKTLKKEQEINRQKTLKRNILIGFLAVLIPLLGLFYVYYQKLKTQSELNKTQEEINKQKVAALLKDQELKLIKASVEGEEKERKRIAQELHDSIGGNLATIKLQLPKEQTTIINQIDETYNQVRDLSHNLMPKKFHNSGFTSLISEYIHTVEKASKETISLHIHPEEEVNKINENLKVELYKIIQELLTNALKHAKASQIDIHITQLDNEIKLLFEDNGIGFNTHELKEGIGFQNIKDRLKKIKGTMYVDAYPNRGTVIDIDVSLT